MRGSQWNKWNIHVHTKGTNKNDQFKSKDFDQFFEVFFKKALQNGIKAIGITDYFSIDNYTKTKQYVQQIKTKLDASGERLFSDDEAERVSEIFILPNVELRMTPSTDAGKLINIHCVFNPAYISSLENNFFNSIENQDRYKMNYNGLVDYGRQLNSSLTDDKAAYNHGINNFTVDPKSFKKLLDLNPTFKNNTIVIVSNSNKDGVSGFQKHYDLFEGEQGSLDGIRRTIYDVSNAIFSANPKDVKYFLGKRLDDDPKIAKEEREAERLLVIKERGSLKPCLVGCDAHTEDDLFKKFTWIKCDLNFEGLKQIIYESEQRVKIQQNEPDLKEEKLVIDEVRFLASDDLFTSEPIKFNRNLNVIIGGKSSGKSILLYHIAKTLLPDRSILKSKESPHTYTYKFDGNFDFEVKIGSGHTQSASRSDDTPSILPQVKYIPQNYLSKLAEPENKKGNDLLKLIRGLLLEDEEYYILYEEFKDRLKSNDLNRETIINNYFELRDKIATQKNDLIQRGDVKVLVENYETNEEKIKKLKEGAGLTSVQIEEYTKYNSELEKNELEITVLRSDHSKINTFNLNTKNALRELAEKKNLLLNSLENNAIKDEYTGEYEIIDEAFQAIQTSISKIELDENRKFVQDNLFKSQFHARAKRVLELKELLKPLVQDQIIKKEIEEIEKLVTTDKQKVNALNQLSIEIRNNEQALEREKKKLFESFRENYQEYIKIIQELQGRTKLLESDNLQINGMPKYNFPKMREKILAKSDGRKLNPERYSLLNIKRAATDNYTIEQIMSEIQDVFSSMVETRDFPFNTKPDIKETIKNLFDDYFFDYWDVVYDNDELKKMSAGKASFVILMLIVGLSKSKAPILIDQPEDNLDNRSITKDLVEYLRNKKLERQIILVTHNANVVVNADAENIIVANQKGQNDKLTTSPYQFDYINGSLENTKPFNKDISDLLKSMGIREHIADIVEGGEEAFIKREKKYGFSKKIGTS